MPHYVQLPSGHWRAIVQHDGLKRTATADTKPEAQRLAAQILLDMGGTVGRRGLTVGDLLATAVTERGASWSPTYADDVDRVIARLPDAFTARAVRTVTPSVISGLYRQLASSSIGICHLPNRGRAEKCGSPGSRSRRPAQRILELALRDVPTTARNNTGGTNQAKGDEASDQCPIVTAKEVNISSPSGSP